MLHYVGALWKKEKNGSKYLSGAIDKLEQFQGKEKISVLVYVNRRKEKDSQPDFNILIATDDNPSVAAKMEAEAKEVQDDLFNSL